MIYALRIPIKSIKGTNIKTKGLLISQDLLAQKLTILRNDSEPYLNCGGTIYIQLRPRVPNHSQRRSKMDKDEEFDGKTWR